jgi:hypothetical protein
MANITESIAHPRQSPFLALNVPNTVAAMQIAKPPRASHMAFVLVLISRSISTDHQRGDIRLLKSFRSEARTM